MKKLFVALMIAMISAVLFVAPAAAELKLTTKGYMQFQGLWMSGSPDENFDADNAWYNMEMVINPILHINDKVRIHGQVRIMERNFSGTAAGDAYAGDAADSKYSLFGDDQNNFWWERLYLSFPLYGGTIYFGRMSGGNWAYPFADSDQNRDRIKYVRKFGHIVWLWVIEKRDERDGGMMAPRAGSIAAAGSGFDQADGDQDAYAMGFVIPLSKNFVYRPLYYGIRDGNGFPGGSGGNWHHLFLNGIMWKFAGLKLDAEIDYWNGGADDFLDVDGNGSPDDIDYEQFAVWAELSMATGPAEIVLGGFWIEGEDHKFADDERSAFFATGERFQPLLIMFSEDMGLFFNSRGVTNPGAVGGAQQSGWLCYYLRGSYKLNDTMKISAILGHLEADELAGLPGVDEDMGWELDFSFQWKFLDNIYYAIDAGYYKPGDYFDDITGGDDDNVYALRNTIKIEW